MFPKSTIFMFNEENAKIHRCLYLMQKDTHESIVFELVSFSSLKGILNNYGWKPLPSKSRPTISKNPLVIEALKQFEIDTVIGYNNNNRYQNNKHRYYGKRILIGKEKDTNHTLMCII